MVGNSVKKLEFLVSRRKKICQKLKKAIQRKNKPTNVRKSKILEFIHTLNKSSIRCATTNPPPIFTAEIPVAARAKALEAPAALAEIKRVIRFLISLVIFN